MRGFHVLVTLFCTRNIKDTQCGFKLFTRKAAKILFTSLHLERWAFDIELIYLAEQLKIPLTEVTFFINICEHQQIFVFPTNRCQSKNS
jgi:dolichyl-phosphate beta-glucosyltransferase